MANSLNIKSRLLNILLATALVLNLIYPLLITPVNAFSFSFGDWGWNSKPHNTKYCKEKYDLLVGTTDRGNVEISTDGSKLYIEMESKDWWKMKKVYIDIGDTLAEIPTIGDNPNTNLFSDPINHNVNDDKETFEINISTSDLTDLNGALIAVYAKLEKHSNTEDAWGEGTNFPGADFGMYITYTCAQATPSVTPLPSVLGTITTSPTPTPTATLTSTPTVTPTPYTTPTVIPSPYVSPSTTPTPTPTVTPSPSPTIIVEECTEGPTWAYSVEYADQGLRKNGTDVLPARSITANALSAPNNQFFSLGQNGTIEVGFQHPVTDVAGNDLSFHEITNGVYPEEKANIEVSQNGTTWFAIGSVTNTAPGGVSYLDFNSTGLPWIQFVKITDTTDFNLHAADADGYDLDAIDATYGLCDDYPDQPEVNVCEVDYSVDNTSDLSTIDTTNGIKTTIGQLSFGSSATAIDSVNNRIYYIERFDNSDDKRLAYYDLTTNTNTIVGLTGSTKIIDKLAFDSNGTLYAMASSREFYTVNTSTGVATLLGTLSVQGGGGDLAFDENGDLYVILLSGNFYRIGIGSLSATFMGDTNLQATGLIYKSDGYFYTATETQLYKFNLASVNAPALVGTDTVPKSNDLTNCAIKPEGGTGTISGRKYKDVNKNGNFDNDEQNAPGNPNRLNGWKIKLFDTDWNKLAVMETGNDTTPAGDVNKGEYKFVNLAAGTYFVCEENRAEEGWIQTQPKDPAFEMHHGLYCYTVELEDGENVNGLRFGNYQEDMPYIYGHKWHDKNKNGEWNWWEKGIEGWKIVVKSQDQEPVEEFDVYASDMLGHTTTTVFDSDKYYLVEVEGTWSNSGDGGIADAEYYTKDDWFSHVDFGQTPGWTPPMLDLLVDDKEIDWGSYNDQHLYKKVLKGKDAAANFRVFDEDITNPDNNEAWYNDNGGSLEVRIYEVETMLETNEDGYYGAEVQPGEYQIVEVNSKGWAQSAPTGPSYCHVDLDFGEDGTCDFGNYKKPKDEYPTPTPNPSEDPVPSVTPPTGTGTFISGFKWEDQNGDGQWGPEEDGVENWNMTLYKWVQQVEVDSTDSNGINVPLANDDYYLQITGDFTYANSDSINNRADAEYSTSNAYTTPNLDDILLIDSIDPTLGAFNPLHNYEYFKTVTTGTTNFSVFDSTYADNEGDLTVTIWQEIDEMLTASDGSYLFENLDPGSYVVIEEDRSGWTQTYPADQDYCWVDNMDQDENETCYFGNRQNEDITPTPTSTPTGTGSQTPPPDDTTNRRGGGGSGSQDGDDNNDNGNDQDEDILGESTEAPTATIVLAVDPIQDGTVKGILAATGKSLTIPVLVGALNLSLLGGSVIFIRRRIKT